MVVSDREEVLAALTDVRNERARSLHEDIDPAASGGANHWNNLDPALRLTDKRLVDILRYWQDKRGDRLMPSRRDIDVLELKAHVGRLHFIEVEYEPFRLRYRLIGTDTTEALDRDMTGRYFDEIYPPDILADAEQAFLWIAENRKPLRQFGQAVYANKSAYMFEIINLPLSEDGVTVNMVLGELVFTLGGQD